MCALLWTFSCNIRAAMFYRMSLTSQSCFCWLPWQQVQNMSGEQGQLDQLISDLILLNTSTHNIENKLTHIINETGLVLFLRLVSLFMMETCKKKPGHTLRAEFIKKCRNVFFACVSSGIPGLPGRDGLPGTKGEAGEKGMKGESTWSTRDKLRRPNCEWNLSPCSVKRIKCKK